MAEPAGSATPLALLNEILKLDYIDVVRDVLNSSTVLNHRLERDYESVQGERVYIPLNVSRNNSFGARAQTGGLANSSLSYGGSETLPTPGEQGYDSIQFQIPEMYGRLIVREKDIKATRNQKGAFVRVLDSEMRHLIRDAKNTLNKYNFGDGTAALASLDGFSAGTFTVFNEGHAPGASPSYAGQFKGVTATGANNGSYYALRHLEVGMPVGVIDVSASTTAVQETAGTITSINHSNNTFVVNDTALSMTVADGDILVPAELLGGQINSAYNNAQMGLMGIVDDVDAQGASTFQGIASSNSWWQANVLDNSQTLRDISLDLYQQAIDEAEIVGDGEITIFLTTYGIRRETLGLLVADKRFVAPYEMDLDGGFRALSYNGIPIVPDRHAPKHIIFGLDEPTIKFYQMSDFEWMEEDGAVLSRLPGLPAYEATLFLYREMATTDRANNVRIEDINDPTTR